MLQLDTHRAVRAVEEYNTGYYRGQRNIDLDRIAYERFRGGLPSSKAALVELVRFVGEEYGGAQARFLPHSFRDEAALIVAQLFPALRKWCAEVAASRSLREDVPGEETLNYLLAPFQGTCYWGVWGSKTLHFLRPDVFPILDSHAKNALGLKGLNSSPRAYAKFCSTFREAMIANEKALAAARDRPRCISLRPKALRQNPLATWRVVR